MSQLSQKLREVRALQGKSLRATASAAGISAPYLQKLERGEVQQPSPAVLHGLSKALEVPYSDLMQLAGHLVPRPSRQSPGVNVLAHALSAESLTANELEKLAEYLTFLRQRERSG